MSICLEKVKIAKIAGIIYTDRARGATLKVRGGGGGGWIVTQSEGGGAENTFFSVTL